MNNNETVCECCWRVIQGYVFIVDDVAMCEDCYIYHVGVEETEESENEIQL